MPGNASNMNKVKKLANVIPVILCGGSGTRLWPLSRQSFPKQFVPLIGGTSLLSLTIERLKLLSDRLFMVAAEDHRFLLADALKEAGCHGDLILEPVARNTAPAMAMAALWLEHLLANSTTLDTSPAPLLLFCPSDHHIPDATAFLETIYAGFEAAQSGSIVTFGVEPSFPSSAYGYVHKDKASRTQESHKHASPNTSRVLSFIEKPSVEIAKDYLLSGEYLWNAGIFLTRADTLIEALRLHAKDILLSCQEAMQNAQTEPLSGADQSSKRVSQFVRPQASPLQSCKSESIDFAVMEHHDNIQVVTFKSQWSDVGSWTAVADLTPKDTSGNQIVGQGWAQDSRNTFIHALERTVVALGVEDLLIVDTADALLVTHRDHAQDVKSVVAQLEKNKDPKALLHRKVHRPWGWYDSIDRGERFQVKRICVKPGASLSLQKHHHRAEHWIVVKGCAEVTKGAETFLLGENQSTYIPIGETHRLHNPGVTELEMIEVQSGSYLGEDDIVRFEDTYGRVP